MPDSQVRFRGDVRRKRHGPGMPWAGRLIGSGRVPARSRIGLTQAVCGRDDGQWGRRFTREPPGRGNGRLDHGTGRDSQGPSHGAQRHRTRQRTAVVGGRRPRKDFDRRRVSVRWLSGTILTGLCGAALMGGAVFAALDGEAHFAANAGTGGAGARGRSAATRHRAQERPPAAVVETNSARHVIRVTTMTKIGEREVPRVRPFVKISSNLALSATELVGQDSAVQSAAAARQYGRRRDAGRRGRRPGACAQCRSLLRHPRSPERDAAPEARGAWCRFDDVHEQGARRRQLHRLGAAEIRPGEHQSRQARLRLAGRAGRSLCRLRGAHRARKHHHAGEDRAARRRGGNAGTSAAS